MITSRWTSGRMAAVALTALLVMVVGAGAALASHTVSWGIGSADGPRTAETGEATTFVVSVSISGQPMGGWPMTARIFDAAGDLVDEIPFSTDGSGVGEFTVPAPEEDGGWIVSVCDDDGCVYGDATLTAPAPPPSEPPSPPEEPTPGETASQATEEEPSEVAVNPEPVSTDGSNRTWVLTGGAGGLLVLVGAGLFFGGPSTRTRRREGRTTADEDEEEEEEEEEEPRDTPPPMLAPFVEIGTETRTKNDWELYVDDGSGKWVPKRKAESGTAVRVRYYVRITSTGERSGPSESAPRRRFLLGREDFDRLIGLDWPGIEVERFDRPLPGTFQRSDIDTKVHLRLLGAAQNWEVKSGSDLAALRGSVEASIRLISPGSRYANEVKAYSPSKDPRGTDAWLSDLTKVEVWTREAADVPDLGISLEGSTAVRGSGRTGGSVSDLKYAEDGVRSAKTSTWWWKAAVVALENCYMAGDADTQWDRTRAASLDLGGSSPKTKDDDLRTALGLAGDALTLVPGGGLGRVIRKLWGYGKEFILDSESDPTTWDLRADKRCERVGSVESKWVEKDYTHVDIVSHLRAAAQANASTDYRAKVQRSWLAQMEVDHHLELEGKIKEMPGDNPAVGPGDQIDWHSTAPSFKLVIGPSKDAGATWAAQLACDGEVRGIFSRPETPVVDRAASDAGEGESGRRTATVTRDTEGKPTPQSWKFRDVREA